MNTYRGWKIEFYKGRYSATKHGVERTLYEPTRADIERAIDAYINAGNSAANTELTI